MPNIDLSILNQRQTPAFYADVFANRPAAGFVGRIFVSTDTFAFYRDNGTGWDLIGGPGTGTVTGSGAAGQVAFWSGSSLISGENNLWWDSTNNHFGINTNTPGTAADIHHDQSTILQLNQTTATNDTRIAFQNAGSSKWRVGNFYSAGSNDYKVNDAVLNINRFTIKSSSGQTFVGDETTSSGLFVVNNSSGDAHIVALGATAPSIRVRNAGVGASLQFGLGLATTTNNFIQGATGGEFCIFNDSLTAQPILFGIKDAGLGNTQEAARISAARNFLIGTTTDAGQKLQVSGTTLFTGLSKIKQTTTNWYDGLRVFNGSSNTWTGIGNNGSAGVISSSYDNTGSYLPLSFYTSDVERVTITAAGNLEIGGTGFVSPSGADKYIGLYGGQDCSLILQDAVQLWEVYVNDDFYINRGSTTVLQLSRTTGAATFASDVRINSANALNLYNAANNDYSSIVNTGSSGTANILFAGSTGNMTLSNAGNLLIGTTTDAGQKLQVNGSANINGTVLGSQFTTASGTVSNPYNVWTTMFTIPGNTYAMYQLIAMSQGNGLTYTATALVAVNSSGIELRNYVPGGALTLQVSGYDIQCLNGSGSTLAIYFNYMKIS